ncbi:hypothetical protein GCM10023310_30190 [Paenibacillus vulneris]
MNVRSVSVIGMMLSPLSGRLAGHFGVRNDAIYSPITPFKETAIPQRMTLVFAVSITCARGISCGFIFVS